MHSTNSSQNGSTFTTASLQAEVPCITLYRQLVRCRNAPKTCVLGVTEVFRLAFAHFCELRTQIFCNG